MSDQARQRGHLRRPHNTRRSCDTVNNLTPINRTTHMKRRTPGGHRWPTPTREDAERVRSSLTPKNQKTKGTVTEDSGLRVSSSVIKSVPQAGVRACMCGGTHWVACTVLAGGHSGALAGLSRVGGRAARPHLAALCPVACSCVLPCTHRQPSGSSRRREAGTLGFPVRPELPL